MYSMIGDELYYSIDKRICSCKYVATCSPDRTHPVYPYRDSYNQFYDGDISMKTCNELMLHVDFISHYKIMLERLKYYECDKHKTALSLTLNKFNEMSNDKNNRVYFALVLCGTSQILNLSVPFPVSNYTYDEIINLLQDDIREHIMKLGLDFTIT